MPDWITHTGIAWLLCKISNRSRYFTAVVMVGSVLPDVAKMITRPLEMLLRVGLDFRGELALAPIHSLVGATLLAVAVASLVAKDEKQAKLLLSGLCIGFILHFAVDSLLFYGITPLAPLTWDSVSFGLIWHDSLLPAAMTIALMVLFKLGERLRVGRAMR